MITTRMVVVIASFSLVGSLLAGCLPAPTDVLQQSRLLQLGALAFTPEFAQEIQTYYDHDPQKVILGYSVEGTPISMEIFGSGPDKVLIVGGIHGNEPTGAMLASDFANYLRLNPAEYEHHTVGIIARANPDGLRHGTRTNASGVDLNRNFPTANWRFAQIGELSHGQSPAGEPETQAVMAAVELLHPERAIDIHSIPQGYFCNNYDGAADNLAGLMSDYNKYPARADIGYPTPGALGCWLGIDLEIPAITLELPREQSDVLCWQDNAAALLAFLQAEPANVGRGLLDDPTSDTEVETLLFD